MTSRFAAAADSCGWSAAVLALVTGLALPIPSRAQPIDPVELSWDAPASCPTAADVRARIRSLAGATSRAGSPLRAAATITQNQDGTLRLKLVIQMDSLIGERTLEARACDDLAGAAAINLALLLKDAESRPGSVESPSPMAAPAQPTTPEPAPAPVERVDSDSLASVAPSRVRGFLQGPLLSWGFGPMPAPSFGASLAGGVASALWSIAAKATLWLPHALDSERPAAGAHVDRFGVSLRVCRAFPFARFELAPCAGLSLELLWARGFGTYVRAETANAAWLAAGVGAQARFELAGWLNLLGSVELKLHAARPQLSIDGIGRIAELGRLGAELTLGIEWIL